MSDLTDDRLDLGPQAGPEEDEAAPGPAPGGAASGHGQQQRDPCYAYCDMRNAQNWTPSMVHSDGQPTWRGPDRYDIAQANQDVQDHDKNAHDDYAWALVHNYEQYQ